MFLIQILWKLTIYPHYHSMSHHDFWMNAIIDEGESSIRGFFSKRGLFLISKLYPLQNWAPTHEEGELCPVLRHVRCPWQTLCLDMNDPETSRFGREINCSKNITGQGWGGELGLIRVILTGALGSWKNHLSILLPHFNFPMLLLEQFIKNLVCVCVCVCVHACMRALRCHVWPCMTLWTGACQTPLSMKFS